MTRKQLFLLSLFPILALAPLSLGQQGEPPLPADPIAFVGHGAMFDVTGKEIPATPEFMRGVQELYRRALLQRADPAQAAAFASKRRQVLDNQAWDTRSRLYADSALIDWLIKEVNPPDADRLAGHNRILQLAVTAGTLKTDEARQNGAVPFEVPAALRDLLVEEGLEGARGDAVERDATSLGGAAYIEECRAAGVPIPPDWGTAQWANRGVLANEFISEDLQAEVFSYQSTSPQGVCIALPRASGSTIQLLGIICLGKASSKACFWDNQQPGESFPIQKGTVVPLSRFFGGADLQKNVAGECTSCHAGENPYVIHPGTSLGLPNLSGLPLTADAWYRPLVRADWAQNDGPTSLLDSVPSEGQCTACHAQGASGGRFPSVSTAIPGYCGTILPKAFSRTMPPGAVGSAAYRAHYDALIAACAQPPASGLISPRLPPHAAVNAVSRSTDKVDVFVADHAGVIYTAAWEPSFSDWWHGWWQINGGRAHAGAPVHVASRAPDKLDVFVIGTDQRVYTAAWEPAFTDGWRGWWGLLGGVAAPGAHVTVVSRGPDKLDAFVVGTDGYVYTAAWEPAFTDGWRGWWRVGNITVPQGSAIHAVSRSRDKLDIFATDVNGAIWTAAWDPGGWRGWWQLLWGGARPGAPVTAVSRGPDKLDVFVVGTDGRVYTAAWQPAFTDGWRGWWSLGETRFPQGAPIHAVSRSLDRLDVFGTDANGDIRTTAFAPATGWTGWSSLRGGRAAAGAPVTAVSRSADKIDAFVVGGDGRVWTAGFSGVWQGWWPMGQ